MTLLGKRIAGDGFESLRLPAISRGSLHLVCGSRYDEVCFLLLPHTGSLLSSCSDSCTCVCSLPLPLRAHTCTHRFVHIHTCTYESHLVRWQIRGNIALSGAG